MKLLRSFLLILLLVMVAWSTNVVTADGCDLITHAVEAGAHQDKDDCCPDQDQHSPLGCDCALHQHCGHGQVYFRAESTSMYRPVMRSSYSQEPNFLASSPSLEGPFQPPRLAA